MSSSDECCVASHHLKWGPLLANEVCRIAQHVRKGEGSKDNEKRMIRDKVNSLQRWIFIAVILYRYF